MSGGYRCQWYGITTRLAGLCEKNGQPPTPRSFRCGEERTELLVCRSKSSQFRAAKLVEAAGVEPASEKVQGDKTTCVSDSLIFDRLMRNRQEGSGLA